MPAVRWADGHEVSAPTYRALERRLRDESFFDREDGRWTYRRSMRHRAWVWGLTDINIYGTARTFIHELVRAGVLTWVDE